MFGTFFQGNQTQTQIQVMGLPTKHGECRDNFVVSWHGPFFHPWDWDIYLLIWVFSTGKIWQMQVNIPVPWMVNGECSLKQFPLSNFLEVGFSGVNTSFAAGRGVDYLGLVVSHCWYVGDIMSHGFCMDSQNKWIFSLQTNWFLSNGASDGILFQMKEVSQKTFHTEPQKNLYSPGNCRFSYLLEKEHHRLKYNGLFRRYMLVHRRGTSGRWKPSPSPKVIGMCVSGDFVDFYHGRVSFQEYVFC